MKKNNFSEIFSDLYVKHGKELEKMRNESLISTIVVIIFIIIVHVYFFKIFEGSEIIKVLAFIVTFFLGIFIIKYNVQKYKKIFKLNALNNLVEQKDCTYQYKPLEGISSFEYNKSKFDTVYDEFYSEDYIEGMLDLKVSFKMSQIKTIEKIDYSRHVVENKVKRIVTFQGLYGEIELPVSIMGKVEIMKDVKIEENNIYKVNVKNEQFEKYYDIFAEDIEWGKYNLTDEMIDILIEIKEFFKTPIQIKMNKNKIYFRLNCGEIFEPPRFRRAMNFNVFFKYYRLIDLPRCIYSIFAQNIAKNSGNSEFERIVKMSEMNQDEKRKFIENEEKELKESWFSKKESDS